MSQIHMFYYLVSQTLTGKEIEIDIEPTDKVWISMSLKCESYVCVFGSICKCMRFFFSPNKVERIKERVEEKEGIPPQQQRLIYSGKQM